MSPSRRPEPPLEILERMRQPVPMAERPDGEARRRAAIDAVATAIRRGGRSRRALPRWLLAGAAAALVISAGFALLVHRSSGFASAGHAAGGAPAALPIVAGSGRIQVLKGNAVATRGTLATTVVAGGVARVAEGDGVTSSADGEALLELPRGVRVKVAASTALSFVKVLDGEQRLRLDLGRTDVSVPKPGGPPVFSIVTPDSEVVVHGTEFSVQVEHDASSAFVTTVSVTRGSVFVAHGAERRLLEPGDVWSSRAETPAAPTATTAHHEPISSGKARPSTPAAPPSLAEQNRLFQSFLDARTAGDNVRAVRIVDELLARFPDTPLADQARVARFRVLQRLGGTERGQEPSR